MYILRCLRTCPVAGAEAYMCGLQPGRAAHQCRWHFRACTPYHTFGNHTTHCEIAAVRQCRALPPPSWLFCSMCLHGLSSMFDLEQLLHVTPCTRAV